LLKGEGLIRISEGKLRQLFGILSNDFLVPEKFNAAGEVHPQNTINSIDLIFIDNPQIRCHSCLVLLLLHRLLQPLGLLQLIGELSDHQVSYDVLFLE